MTYIKLWSALPPEADFWLQILDTGCRGKDSETYFTRTDSVSSGTPMVWDVRPWQTDLEAVSWGISMSSISPSSKASSQSHCNLDAAAHFVFLWPLDDNTLLVFPPYCPLCLPLLASLWWTKARTCFFFLVLSLFFSLFPEPMHRPRA